MSDATAGSGAELRYTPEELKSVPELNLKGYITTVYALAKEVETQTGIHAIVPIIQSAHESRNGNSGLSRNHCNLFGVTATDSWKKAGRPVANLPTWEVIGGKRVDLSREFREYPNWRESFQDWAKIITTLSIYKPAYALLKDRNTLRAGIRVLGKIYATDDEYSKKLLALFDSLNSIL